MDALNYILFKNPVSSTLIHGTNSALQYAGITAKPTSSTRAIQEVMRPFESLGSGRFYIRLAGLSGATASVLAAMGAHRKFSLESEAEQAELKRIFETANRFHFFSTMALLGVPFARKPHLTGTLFLTGTLLFCGPTYYRALTNDPKNQVRRVVPIGGFMLIAAWLSFIL